MQGQCEQGFSAPLSERLCLGQSVGGACNLDVHAANRHPYTFQIEFPDGGALWGSTRIRFEPHVRVPGS